MHIIFDILVLLWLFRFSRKLDTVQLQLSQVLRTLKRMGKSSPASRVDFYTVVDGIKRKVSSMNLKVSQKLPVAIEIKDKFGNPATVDGAPVWSLTDPSKGELVASEDGMSAVFTPAGSVGEVTIQASADADLGEGVKSILGELPVSLLAGEAVSVAIAAGEPSDI